MLKINEVFKSIQGEGSHAGERVLFIRLFGCNKKCKWCDTTNTCNIEFSKEDFYNLVKDTKFPIVITGGEPLVQKNELFEHITYLRSKNVHKLFHLETNCSINDPSYLFDYFSHISASPKFEETTNSFDYRVDVLRSADDIKIVYDHEIFNKTEESKQYIKAQLLDMKFLNPSANFYLHPKWDLEKDNCNDSLNEIKKLILNDSGFKGFRLGLQMHKYIGVM